MTPKERAAMQQALEALELGSDRGATVAHKVYAETKAITALREALAEQAEQEPVAAYKDAPRVIYLQTGCEDPEFCECSFNEWGDTTWCADKIHDTDIPYIREDYAAPVRTKDLTDDEIRDELNSTDDVNGERGWIRFARAVIAADREKNK